MFPKHGYPNIFMIRKSYLPTTVFFIKIDISHGGGVTIAIRDTIPATAVNVSIAVVSNPIEVVSVNLMHRKRITI